MSLDFSGKHVVVTGGTGALGTAVVSGLLAAGATCTVPYLSLIHISWSMAMRAVGNESLRAD